MTVNELIKKLEALAAEGHGEDLVITSSYRDVTVKVHEGTPRYIGGSEWDDKEYSRILPGSKGHTVTL